MKSPENTHVEPAEHDARPYAHIDSITERVYFADEEPMEKRRTAGKRLAADALALLGLVQPDQGFPAAIGTMH